MTILCSFVALVAAAALCVSATTYSMMEGGTQFIYYNGSLAGSFVPNVKFKDQRDSIYQNCEEYSAYYFEKLLKTGLYIGKNPEWDPNPFFFNLLQYDEREIITELSFASTYYPCYKYGEPCGSFELSPWYYIAATIVDLNKASITVINGSSIDAGEKGSFYAVTGNEKTFVGNGTTNSTFYFTPPGNYTHACASQANYMWYVKATKLDPCPHSMLWQLIRPDGSYFLIGTPRHLLTTPSTSQTRRPK